MLNRRLAVLIVLSCASGLGCAQRGAAARPAPPGPQPMQVLPIEEARWLATEFKGVEAAVLWGDPERDARGGELLRMAGGLVFPRHRHTYDERVIVLAGTFVLVGSGGAERTLHAGSYYYLPAATDHASRCAPGAACLVYSEVIPVAPATGRL